MNYASHLVNIRIAWCRQQSAGARTESELDEWRAEEEGLRDALLKRDHALDYRLSTPEVFERYVQGFQDGTALMRAACADRIDPSCHQP